MKLSPRLDCFDLSGARGDLAAAADALKQTGQPFLDLTVSNPTRASLTYPGEAIRDALSAREILQYGPNPQGLEEARKAVAAYYGDRGWPVEPEQLTLTSGTSEAYSFLLKLLCGPGDEVLIPRPSYPLLDYLLHMECVEGVTYPLRYREESAASGPRWKIDFECLEAAITPRTRALIFVQPNNPTGNILSREETQKLAELAEKHRFPLIIDEVFCDYLFSPWEFVPVRSRGVPVFTLNGISKVLALPQMKLSWILMEGDSALLRPVREGLEIIADTYLSVNTPVQTALPRLLTMKEVIQEPIRTRLRTNLENANAQFTGHPALHPLAVQGGWYLALRIDTRVDDETTAIALLQEKKVYLHPGGMFGFDRDRCFVLSLLTPEPVFREGVERIASFAR